MLTTKPTSQPAPYKVLRAFFLEGDIRAPGAVVQLAGQFAVEMLAAGKVAPHTEPAAPAVEADAAKPARKAKT